MKKETAFCTNSGKVQPQLLLERFSMQVLWMVVGAFLFATMGACIKYAAVYFNTAEIVFYRGLIGMLVLWLLNSSQGVSLRTKKPWMHAWRSLMGVTIGSSGIAATIFRARSVAVPSSTVH